MSKLKSIIKKSNRYSNFILLDSPIPFDELFKDKNFELVQLHSTQIIGKGDIKDIVGFCGVFYWQNNEIIPLDGDSYNKSMMVLGYEMFKNEEENISTGLDILVGNDW